MEIRQLAPGEHIRTRALYEEAFPEDDAAFVDYYYKWKAADNRIYAAEDEDGIHAMVHLNPYLIYDRGELRRLHYIVAVATQKEYRRRGLMRLLLQRAEEDMRAAGEPFVFLMPAAEQIYYPLGYRFFSRQRCGLLYASEADAASVREMGGTLMQETGEVQTREADDAPGGLFVRPVYPHEYAALAQFANEVLRQQYDVFVYRDAAYYERLCAEQNCQGGEVMVLCREDDASIIGSFCSAQDEEGTELREIIVRPEYLQEGAAALRNYVRGCGAARTVKSDTVRACRVAGCVEGIPLEKERSRPLLMAKQPCGGAFLSEWAEDKIFINEVV